MLPINLYYCFISIKVNVYFLLQKGIFHQVEYLYQSQYGKSLYGNYLFHRYLYSNASGIGKLIDRTW